MRRMMCVATALFLFSISYGQQKAIDFLNIQSVNSAPVTEAKAAISNDDKLNIYNYNQYRYTLNPEQGKEYKDYQVIKLDGLTNKDILTGMITNTLDRETRYIELSESNEQIALVREALDGKADYVFVNPYEKEYFIAADGSFRYIDGRDLVGSKKVKTYLEKGKPVTATTFFFALKDKGLINAEVSLRQFISLSTEDKVKLLGMDIYASPKEAAGTASSEIH